MTVEERQRSRGERIILYTATPVGALLFAQTW